MSSPYKLRMPGEPPYSPAVPQPLPDPPPARPVRAPREPRFVAPEEIDILAALEEQQRADDANESIGKALVAGLVAAVLCTVVVGGFAALTGCWHRALCVGIAFVVALAVKHFGRGNDRRFGFVGAFWSLAGCVGAYYFALPILSARMAGMPLLEYMENVKDWGLWVNASLRWPDLFFYAVAMCCGYRFSHDALAERY